MNNFNYFAMGVSTPLIPIQIFRIIEGGDNTGLNVFVLILLCCAYIPLLIEKIIKPEAPSEEEIDEREIGEFDDWWVDNYEKTQYRIRKISNKAGLEYFQAQRSMDGINWVRLPMNTISDRTQLEAQRRIMKDFERRKESWLSENTREEEFIPVNTEDIKLNV
jgi:hypothetical protein